MKHTLTKIQNPKIIQTIKNTKIIIILKHVSPFFFFIFRHYLFSSCIFLFCKNLYYLIFLYRCSCFLLFYSSNYFLSSLFSSLFEFTSISCFMLACRKNIVTNERHFNHLMLQLIIAKQAIFLS